MFMETLFPQKALKTAKQVALGLKDEQRINQNRNSYAHTVNLATNCGYRSCNANGFQSIQYSNRNANASPITDHPIIAAVVVNDGPTYIDDFDMLNKIIPINAELRTILRKSAENQRSNNLSHLNIQHNNKASIRLKIMTPYFPFYPQSPQASTSEPTATQLTPILRNSNRAAQTTCDKSDSDSSSTTRESKRLKKTKEIIFWL